MFEIWIPVWMESGGPEYADTAKIFEGLIKGCK